MSDKLTRAQAALAKLTNDYVQKETLTVRDFGTDIQLVVYGLSVKEVAEVHRKVSAQTKKQNLSEDKQSLLISRHVMAKATKFVHTDEEDGSVTEIPFFASASDEKFDLMMQPTYQGILEASMRQSPGATVTRTLEQDIELDEDEDVPLA